MLYIEVLLTSADELICFTQGQLPASNSPHLNRGKHSMNSPFLMQMGGVLYAGPYGTAHTQERPSVRLSPPTWHMPSGTSVITNVCGGWEDATCQWRGLGVDCWGLGCSPAKYAPPPDRWLQPQAGPASFCRKGPEGLCRPRLGVTPRRCSR